MQFSQAISFPFRGPNFWVNFGCSLLCFIIPIVGPIVLTGYVIRIEAALLEDLRADAPRFDFNKFSQYLSRGLQVFLANLLLALISVVPLLLLPALFAIPGMLLLAQHFTLAFSLFVVAGIVYFAGALFLGVLMAPLSFKAGLEDNFNAAFDFRFGLDYVRRVGLLHVGYQLLLMLCVLPCMVLACIPCLGYLVTYAMAALLMPIQAHLQTQLYVEYLARGGIVVTPKYEPPDPAFPVIMPSSPPPMPPDDVSNYP